MEYPGTKFTHPIRKAMLIFFIGAFFVLAPIILLYTEGYRYDWKNGLLKETGAISIDILPKNTSVYLNGIHLKDKMPIRLNNIAPAKYTVRLTSNGFYEWYKEIEVKNKQTSYIKEINLIQKEKPQLLVEGRIQSPALSHDSNFIIYTIKNKTQTEIWLLNLKSNNRSLLFKTEIADPKIVWAKNNNFAFFFDRNKKLANIVNAEKPNDLINLNDFEKAYVTKMQWSETNEPQLFYSTSIDIVTFYPITKQKNKISKNNFSDWDMSSGHLWTMILDTSSNQYKIAQDVLGFKSAFSDFPSNDSKWEMLAVHDDAVLLKKIGASDMAMISNKGKYNFSGDKFMISKYNDWWLMWSKWELWTYSHDDEPYLLSRSGENLKDVEPMDEYNTLALVWNDKTTALYPYYLVSNELLNEKIESAEADTKNKILYFSAEIKGQSGLWKLNY